MSRLEEIKSNIEYNRFGSKIALTESEYNYLIQRAERVQELEKENNRYREALNSIITSWIASTDATNDTWLAHEMSKTARKAIEGDLE